MNDGDFPAKDSAWKLPQILLYDNGQLPDVLISGDDEAGSTSVLHVQDLGDVFRLKDALNDWSILKDQHAARDRIRRIAFILGTSLARLHSRESSSFLESRPDSCRILSQNLTDDVVWYLMMERLPRYLTQATPEKAEEYNRRLVEDIKHEYPSCLMHGDFNFGNILLSRSVDQAQPYVIDWEFATSNGRGVNGDVPEFLAMLHCLVVAKYDAHADLIRLLCRDFCEAYGEQSCLKCAMTVDDLPTQLYRSTMLLVGRNMVTFAHDNCEDDESFNDMIRVALWYFEHAGADIHHFVSDANKESLKQEDEQFLHRLFSSA